MAADQVGVAGPLAVAVHAPWTWVAPQRTAAIEFATAQPRVVVEVHTDLCARSCDATSATTAPPRAAGCPPLVSQRTSVSRTRLLGCPKDPHA